MMLSSQKSRLEVFSNINTGNLFNEKKCIYPCVQAGSCSKPSVAAACSFQFL